jgi:acyl-CoA synthetase (AMP-forming)/AMP-acid ligase II
VLVMTAGLFHRYAEALSAVFTKLKSLLVGGDVVDARVVKRVLERSRPQHLIHAYGPTETTLFATTFEVQEVAEGATSLPIGRPIGNTTAYILDPHGEPVPVGVTGELYIGGAGVARGYLNRPDLTAERFVADPFAAESGAQMYRTGDLARHRGDGNIEFLGRADSQVKLRGYRIELSEIEARIGEWDAVGDVAVLVREDHPGDKRLVAYYTAATSGQAVTSEQLRTRLSAVLPEYMVPSAYVRLERLPLTPNGKVDRKALPAPDVDAYVTRAYEAPVGPVEETLARIWCDILKVERVGRHDDFFELGGHSLLALGLMERMRREGLQADATTVFVAPTLTAFAAQTEETVEMIL